jgi:Domain of unknown function (DUF4091)
MTWQAQFTRVFRRIALGVEHLSYFQVGTVQKEGHFGPTPGLLPEFSAVKRKFSLVLLLLATSPVLSVSQNDPLSPAYLPSIDTNASNYPSNIWITDTMQKVRQDSGTPGTQHWGTFYGTQNEFVDFQVHFHDANTGTSNLTVTASDFVQSSPVSFTISASSTDVVVYREQYMNVSIKSSTSNTYYNATGLYPDILIPAKDPYWHQTTNAWPVTVAAGKNQSAWIDVHIPSNAPSGYYLGSVTVKSGSTVLSILPVVIAVWQWPGTGFMPSTATLKGEMSDFGYGALCTQMYVGDGSTGSIAGCAGYPDSGGGADGGITQTFIDAGMLMKDHRFGYGGRENIYPESGSFASYVTQIGPNLNGTCTHGGTVCGILSGAKLTTKQLAHAASPSSAIFSNWQTNFNSNGWSTAGVSKLFDYLCDEPPNGCSWSTLNANAATRHAYSAPLVAELVTADYPNANANGALNSIDILVSNISKIEPIGGPLQNLANYRTWLAGPNPDGIQRQWWSYQACDSNGSCSNGTVGSSTATWPNLDIDGKPAANRAMEWLTYLHGQTGELYYAADYCLIPSNNSNCGNGAHGDPWLDNYAFGGWGEGALIQAGGIVPGKTNYMGPGVTIPLVLPTVRLKHIRDGMQDYEYLYELEQAGKSALVQQQISSWVTNSYTFETNGNGLASARMALGTALHQIAYPSVLLPPTNLRGTVQ